MDPFDDSDSLEGPSKAGTASGVESEPWSRFSAWLECVCVVKFDLELGQAIELVYPNHADLTEKESTFLFLSHGDPDPITTILGLKMGYTFWIGQPATVSQATASGDVTLWANSARSLEFCLSKKKTSICYLSFPDSYSGSLGDTQFSFRLRQSVGRGAAWFSVEDAYSKDAPATLQKEHAHFHGYVYFRQVKDPSVKRGYFQKSLVLVSRLPFVQLFHSLLQIIAPEYFEKLEPCLETVCNEIDQWPAPVPGQTLNLPVMGVVLQVRIPAKVETLEGKENTTETENLLPVPTILPSVYELDLFKCFQSVLIHLQMLWELMLLAEPVVVMAPSPTVCSETVLALVSSISPLHYCGDYRPYFTLHDSEFKEYTTRTQAPPNVTLGVTNPFFLKTFQCWPHIIRLGEPKMSGDLPKQIKIKKLEKLKTLDAKTGFYTAYKNFLHKDKALIKLLLKGIQKQKPSDVLSAILRQHLFEQTESFILPLEEYLSSLMPPQRSVSPWKTPPQIRSFSQEEFLQSLENGRPQHTLKGDWTGLYRRFFRSPNFEGWYRLRHREMAQKVECLHLDSICAADLLTWTKDKSEVEIVDFILKLKEKLQRTRKHKLWVKEEELERLDQDLQTIISSLPENLQTVLHRGTRSDMNRL